MAKKLSEVLADGYREITTDEAAVLSKMGLSGVDVNEKARRAMTYFLEGLLKKTEIEDDEAKSCLEVFKQSATADQKALCNKVLAKYVGKFDFAISRKKECAVEA